MPKAKRPKLPTNTKHIAGTKRGSTGQPNPVKKKPSTNDDCVITNTVGVDRTEYPNFRYYQVNETWQLQTCERLGLTYTKKFACQCGSPDTVLTCPDLRSLKRIDGDGNCLFWAISYIVIGSERQHLLLRNVLIGYMLSIPHLLIGHRPDGFRNCIDTLTTTDHLSVDQYIQSTSMDRDGTWGSAIEIACLSHVTRTCLCV